MTAKTADGKLARQLQKRGSWHSYSTCLRQVQAHLTQHPAKVVAEVIARGELDAPKVPALDKSPENDCAGESFKRLKTTGIHDRHCPARS